MPIYEYRCGACGSKQEVLQKMSEPPLRDCPSCGEPALTKLVSAAGFQLKGSGWYVTDFRNGSKGAKPADKGADKTADKGADKSESKSGEEKSESKSSGEKSETKSAADKSESKTKPDAKSTATATG